MTLTFTLILGPMDKASLQPQPQPHPHQVDALFRLMDKDGSGAVDYNELRRTLRRKPSSPATSNRPKGRARFVGAVDAEGRLLTKANVGVAVRKVLIACPHSTEGGPELSMRPISTHAAFVGG